MTGEVANVMEEIKEVQDIRLRRDVVIVRPIEEKEINGLIIPQHLQEDGQVGVVYNVGPGDDDVKMEVSVGDKVLYCKFAGSEVQIDENKYMIMRQGDILAKFNGERKIDLIPLEDRILIEWETGQNEYKGTKILRPEGSAKERYFTGTVMSIGPMVKDIAVGNRIFFDQFCGPERIDFESKRYALIWEKDAYCVIPKRKNMMVLSH